MRYQVKALRGPNEILALTLDARDEADAHKQLQRQGLQVVSLRAEAAWMKHFMKRGARFDLVLFSQELLALLNAGLNLVEAMETLAEKEARPDAKMMLEKLINALYEGQTFSTTLANFPEIFPDVYTASVKASEKTGDMPEALGRYISYATQMEQVKKRLVSASIYPVILITTGLIVTLFLMIYVVPKFSKIYNEASRSDLPFLSQVLMSWGGWVSGHVSWVLIGLAASVAGLVFAVTRPALREAVLKFLWRRKNIGEQLRVFQLARFYRTTGMLLRGGIPMVTALGMVSGLLHPSLRERLVVATNEVREGQSFSQVMDNNGLTTPVASRMLRVGERSGRMGEMMERIAQFYDEDMARFVDWFTKLFEPLLMVVIGLIIGGVVILMYMPIFELAGSIQ